jgi:outer membrane protein TolC
MKRTAVLAALGAPLLALAACAPTVRISSPDVRLPTAFEAPVGAAASTAALDRWWAMFQDAQLTDLVEQALRASPDARAALARLEEARQVRAGLLAQFLPQGPLQASASAQDTHQTFGGTGGFFSQPSGRSENLSLNFSPSW